MRLEKSVGPEIFSSENLDKFDPESVQLDLASPGLVSTDEQRSIYHLRNERQAQQNPQMAEVLRDPAAFFAKLESRFEAQKALTPEDPYAFEFADYGLPVLEDLSEALGQEDAKLLKSVQLDALRKTGGKSALLASSKTSPVTRFFKPFAVKKENERTLGRKFITELKKDIDSHLKSGEISYRRLNELAYFSARALGHFDHQELSAFDKTMLKIDRHFLGYNKNTIEGEYEKYLSNDAKVFAKPAGRRQIEWVSEAYETASNNLEKFEIANLPVARSVGPGAFMQLQPHDVYLMGVSAEPEAADGFNRPGGDFFLHDARHAAMIFTKRKLYEQHHNISPTQAQRLEVMTSVWKQEMVKEKKKLEDKELSYAIGLLSFNTHHDRGFPQLPSSFIEDDRDNVALALHAALKISGQPTGFSQPKKTLNQAYDWLREFWLERLPQEEAILAASA